MKVVIECRIYAEVEEDETPDDALLRLRSNLDLGGFEYVEKSDVLLDDNGEVEEWP